MVRTVSLPTTLGGAAAVVGFLVFVNWNWFEPVSLGRDCSACPEMMLVPGGVYRRGAWIYEKGYRPTSEAPLGRIRIDAFALARTEATFAQWDACAAEGFCRPIDDDEGWGRGDQPVVNLSYSDITGGGQWRGFIAWLNAKVEGEPYRLPSESEWEYAARAGTRGPFNVGRTITTDEANFDGTEPYRRFQSRGENRGRAIAVGSFPPNALGLNDMHGNVAELTADCYTTGRTIDPARKGDIFPGSGIIAPEDGSAFEGFPGTPCEARSLRGGSWRERPERVRSGFRWSDRLPRDSLNEVGFRVARTLPPGFDAARDD